MKRPWRFIRNWGGMGNLVDGDCTVAAYYHVLMALNVLNGSSFKKILYRLGFRVPGTKFALKEYTAYLATLGQKPGKTGVAPDGWLNWQKEQGNVLGWKYVEVPGQALSEQSLRTALDNFGGAILVGCLTSAAYNQMANPWVVNKGDVPNPNLGHAVAFLDYTDTDDRCVTWGKWHGMTIDFRELCFNGAFVFAHKNDPNAQEKLQLLAQP